MCVCDSNIIWFERGRVSINECSTIAWLRPPIKQLICSSKFDIPSKKLSIFFLFIEIYSVSIIKLLDLPKKTRVRYMRPDWLRYLEISLLVIISLTLLMVMGCLCRKCCIWCECCDDDDDENYNKTDGV